MTYRQNADGAVPEDRIVEALRRLAPTASRMTSDSRQVVPGDVFLAFPGDTHDGRGHIPQAIQAGAAAVLWEPAGFAWKHAWNLPQLAVANLRQQAAALAAAWYGQPSRDLWMTGVTGTNGKTSVSHWLAQAFGHLGRRTAVVGTLGNGFPGDLDAASHTTPDAVTLQGLLAHYRDAGATGVAMEVSSHGLDQGRVDAVAYDVAVLTNLSRDHLDYHGSMEAYAAAKASLFHRPGLKVAVLNADDPFGVRLTPQVRQARVIRYGLEAGDLRARMQADRLGLKLEIASPWGQGQLESPLLGTFNAYNLLAALGALLAADIPLADALTALARVRATAGRTQKVEGFPQAPTVIIDYAHSPDALEKVLAALKPLTTGRLICVFGSGGGRDTGKRPLMGAAVASGADVAVLTSDNPRDEDPARIVADILQGMPDGQRVILDRRQAIQTAIAQAGPEDIVLLAGKGHEDYQEIGGVRRPFSDLVEARAALARWRPA
ncbi:MAG TPA: UDP-N-acetylmuramoyl-L-alanyl-D-glutamate--2,6-diaminopimelate ligase [Thiobacillaceae bacterium]|nr:UDP-N-acetylmuramoyl-L-alanyl-D-glutamate--2,6-diaminopimelate ligase [Thiobacillaceae bacterium]HNU63709.1 UDP-N-acetylmuramoyl-L-alanyl-D-glutamate--2,6-diaminopimelate ligase [Thiobacillaceae bacterium]